MTAYIMHQFGPKPVVDMARKMGVTSYLQAVPSICLETFDMSVKEITGSLLNICKQRGLYRSQFLLQKSQIRMGL